MADVGAQKDERASRGLVWGLRMWLDDLGQIACRARMWSAVRKRDLNLNVTQNLKAWVLAGAAGWEQIGKAREDLLPADSTLILNKKRRKTIFPESEFNIDKLCKALPVLMYVSPSIKNEERVSLSASQSSPGSLLLAPDPIESNMNINILTNRNMNANYTCEYEHAYGYGPVSLL